MEFCSTRNNELRVTAAQAILQGLAPDGGLFVPTELPSFSEEQIMTMAAMSYPRVAETVMAAFLPGFSKEELRGFCKEAYTGRFDDPQVAPLRNVRPGLWSLELWHGPTCAFKDMALQMLPRLLPAAAKKCGEDKQVVILTATSGDTGKAALEGFAGVEGTKICVFYPKGGVSEMQRLQMVTQQGDNVQVFAVEGNFDDTQSGVKAIFTNEAVRTALAEKGMLLSSANSINWGRLAPQIAYYFWAYAQLLKSESLEMGDKVNFVVPTGNFGNILAGWLAKKSGLPVDKLICASNQNNVLTQFLQTGTYDKNRPFHLTASPSMDILISSNLERLLWFVTENGEQVKHWMQKLNSKGVYRAGAELADRLRDEGFMGFWCDDKRAFDTIQDLWFGRGYLCDPHTGVAMNAYNQYTALTGDKTPTIAVSTASPFKFAKSMLPAMGLDFDGDDFQRLEALEIVSCRTAPPSIKTLRDAPVRFDKAISKSKMKESVLRWLEAQA